MKNDKTIVPFSIMALIVPAAEAAVGKNWLPTLMLVLVTFLLCSWMSMQGEPDWKWLYPLRLAALILLLSWALQQTHSCWPGEKAELAVPAGLLFLAAYSVWKGSAIRASSVLRYGMYFILAVLSVLGIGQMNIENIQPKAELPDMELAAVLLLPLLARKTGKFFYNPVGIAALISSIAAGGCVSVYQFSRSVSIGGIAQHLESVAACAITVGYFALLCYLLDGISNKTGAWNVWTTALAAYGIYLLGIPLAPQVYVLLLILLWVIIPELWNMGEKIKKGKIPLDK